MSSASKIVRSRTSGRCDNISLHVKSNQIRVGDLVRVTTVFPGDEFHEPWTRFRSCNECVRRDCRQKHRPGYSCGECGTLVDRAFWRKR